MSKSLSFFLSLSHFGLYPKVFTAAHTHRSLFLLLLSDEEFHKINEVILFSWSLSPQTTEWSPKSSLTMLKWLFLSIYPLSQQHVHSYLFVPFRLCTWPGIIFSLSLPWRIRCIFPSHTNSNFCESFYHVTDIDDRHNQASSSLSLPYDSMKIWSLW